MPKPDKALIYAMIAAAHDARERAYAPYSKFKVGAAVLGASGRVYTGCNVENASYGLTVCAERTAIVRAVSEGETSVSAVIVVAGERKPSPPCGACLQVISEFSSVDDPATIVICSADGSFEIGTLAEYLPAPFRVG